MRYISLLVLALSLLINSAYAQSSLVAKRNDNAATVLAPTNLQLSALAVDSSGRLFIGGSQVEDTL
jgi:hypothetical protein